MTNKLKRLKFLSLPVAAFGFLLLGGSSFEVAAQRDPFAKPNAPKPSVPRSSSPSSPSSPTAPTVKPKPAAPTVVAAPSVQDRITYYRRLREEAALNNQPIPNPTVVMTLDELSVSGVFQTPRGYAAVVEAKPIKLSYTIYPGDKFFDGQLVAIEENKLIFKRVTKMTNGKFIASEVNKPLREYTIEQEVQGTAPIEPSGKTESASSTAPAETADDKPKPVNPRMIVSPLDEMNRQPPETTDTAKSKSDKKGSANNKKSTSSKAKEKSAKKPVRAANTDL
jgi:hypothetical protein